MLATNHHDVGGGPDEQWVTIQSAGAFLLSQYMTWAKTPPGGMSQQDYVKLNDLLWTFCAALRWSKWDYRSTWYIKDVKPLQEQCDKCEGA